jgi:hypothetical protein
MIRAPELESQSAIDGPYERIQHFYARQMHMLDAGDTAAPGPDIRAGWRVRGRRRSGAGARALNDSEGRPVSRLSNSCNQELPAAISSACSPSSLRRGDCQRTLLCRGFGDSSGRRRRCTVCEDVMVRADGNWLVRHRRVIRDGLDDPARRDRGPYRLVRLSSPSAFARVQRRISCPTTRELAMDVAPCSTETYSGGQP